MVPIRCRVDAATVELQAFDQLAFCRFDFFGKNLRIGLASALESISRITLILS
jgi:hypothetical protein